MQRNITLRQFRYFIAVAESRSVAAASRELAIAQSAVTKSVIELELMLGSRLFDRSSRGMTLTPEGHRFLASARKVLSAVTEATRLDRDPEKRVTGELAVGVTSLVAGYYLSDLFARFKRNCPAVRFGLIEDDAAYLEHLLISGEIDIAIMVTNALSEPQALVVENLTRSQTRVWMASNHPLAAEEDVPLADCALCEQIALQADRIESVLRAVWTRHQLKPSVLMRTSSLEAVRSLVGIGAGIALLPDFLYRPWTLDAEHVDVRNLRDAVPTVDIGLVWRRGAALPRPVSEFIEVAREQSRLRRTGT